MTPSRPAALIVENQPFVGLVASDILGESGFETYHAYGAQDAIEVLGEHPEIQVVVTDVRLSGDVGGLELARRLAREWPDVRLVVTAADTDFRESEMPEGARMLRKPYASGELRTVVAGLALLQDA